MTAYSENVLAHLTRREVYYEPRKVNLPGISLCLLRLNIASQDERLEEGWGVAAGDPVGAGRAPPSEGVASGAGPGAVGPVQSEYVNFS